MLSRALEAAAWAEGAGAAQRRSSRALIFGRARLAGCRAAGGPARPRAPPWVLDLLPIWDPLECVRLDASLGRDPFWVSRSDCVRVRPSLGPLWGRFGDGRCPGECFHPPGSAERSKTRTVSWGRSKILHHVFGVGEETSTPK